MEWNWEKILAVAGGSVATIIAAVFASAMGWIRFRRKDDAETKKIEVETTGEQIENEIKITNVALKIAAQYAEQLHQSNETIDTLHKKITAMQTEFNARVEELEQNLDEQKRINTELTKQLEHFINGRKKT